MAILPNRETLKEKLAESLTSPDFIALSTLDPGDGTYLSLEARVRCRKGPVKLEVQRPAEGDYLEYSMIKDCLKFCGKVDLIEDEKDRIIARVSLDRVNGKPVFVVPDKRGNDTICYTRNGKFIKMTKERIGYVNYWVPTILNHMSQNADYFLRAVLDRPSARQSEHVQRSEHHSYSVNIEGIGTPKCPHFRSSFERNYTIAGEDGEETIMTMQITGTFVKQPWNELSLDEVVSMVRDHAGQISPLHFQRRILKQITSAGHPYDAVLEAYNSSRAEEFSDSALSGSSLESTITTNK
jgi:hypothetical protein